jgi:hypothetical protein
LLWGPETEEKYRILCPVSPTMRPAEIIAVSGKAGLSPSGIPVQT